MRRFALALVAAAITIGPAPATAAPQYVAPPGNSAVDEYTEAVPGPGGATPVGSGPERAGGRSSLPARTQRELRRSGPDGAAAAELADRTAVDSAGPEAAARDSRTAQSGKNAGSDGESGAGGGTPDSGQASTAEGDTVLSQVADAVGGSGQGMGAALPIVLVSALLVAVGVALGRRSRRSS